MMKAIKIISLALLVISVFCQGCSSDEQVDNTRTITISNGGKTFEYWIGQSRYSSGGGTITTLLDKGTQITVCGIVEVREGKQILPDIQIYQDGSKVVLVKITSSFYWYEVK
jgi:hypothetical protein